ncbi:MAG: RNA pseudouridine synthase, partial [Pseudomonadota bacterium]
VADPLYGTGFATKANLLNASTRALVEALGRQALHAAHLGFAHPITGETMAFHAPAPEDLARLTAALTAEAT